MTQPAQRALIVIDAQNDYICGRMPIEYPPLAQSMANIGRAMDAARAAGIPVVAVQHILPENAPFLAKGTSGADLHQVVASRGWDHYVLKSMPSSFCGTNLDAWLRERQIDTITVVGYMTQNCDFAAVVHGMHSGFKVELLSDATGAVSAANRAGSATAEEIYRVITVVMQARFAAVLTTDEWLESVASGREPERDNVFASNRRALQGCGSDQPAGKGA